ncbi:SH3 domain-containing protein [Sedimentitalea sp. CY04]|uniref:SH3 domain-containing protein n=1 Tax=Parasedimentitalea denitrificans TaxID=2211118 RepID=A0ABX0WDY7_9RHOB|nr:SH3 domain-containing protein [Sedimentitalea sp. CY04]NIZ62461.1 SH3 domain-containing protein [Sedimentitalea sp. CY04]
MSRFVMVSFMFMGWAFYEVSGGADFAPPERPTAIDVAKMPPIADQHVTAASLVTKPVIQPEQTPVLQPSIPHAAAALPDRPKADPDLRSRVVLSQIAAVGETTFGFGIQTSTTPSNDTSVQLASLSGGLTSLADNKIVSDTPAEPITPLIPAADLRHVTASRVNMRDGPGTLHPVVSKLNRNAAVEVLGDSGTGWLRLRVVDGEQVGWIAASLISHKRP